MKTAERVDLKGLEHTVKGLVTVWRWLDLPWASFHKPHKNQTTICIPGAHTMLYVNYISTKLEGKEGKKLN